MQIVIDISKQDYKNIVTAIEPRMYATLMQEAITNGTPLLKEYEAKVITRGNCMMCGKELIEGLFFCKKCETEAEMNTKRNCKYCKHCKNGIVRFWNYNQTILLLVVNTLKIKVIKNGSRMNRL